jgi:hypothetical protein
MTTRTATPTAEPYAAPETNGAAESAAAADRTQQEYFRITDRIPEQAWYWAALGAVAASAGLFLAGRRDWSVFVGQWPPTFLLLALFHKVLRPSR